MNDIGHQTWAQAESEAYKAYQESLYAYGRSYYCESTRRGSLVPAADEDVLAEAERLARVPGSTDEGGAEIDADVDAEDDVDASDAREGREAGEGEARSMSATSTRPPPRRNPARHQPSNGETFMLTRPTPRPRNQHSNAEASTSTRRRRPSCGLRLPDDSDDLDTDDDSDSEDWQSVLQYLDNPTDLSDSDQSSGSNPGSMGSTPFVQSQQPVHRMFTHNPSLLDPSASFEFSDDIRDTSNANGSSPTTTTAHVPTVEDTPAGGVVPRDVDSMLQETPAGPPAPPPINPDLSRGVVPRDVDSTLRETPGGTPAPPPINPDLSHGVAPHNVDSTLQETPAGAPPNNVDSALAPTNPIVSRVGKKKGKAKAGDGMSPRKRTAATQDKNVDPGASSKRKKTTEMSKTANPPAVGNKTPLGTQADNGGSNPDKQVNVNRRSNRDRRPHPPVDEGAESLVKKKKRTKGRGKM